jgi:Ankyrin repeat
MYMYKKLSLIWLIILFCNGRDLFSMTWDAGRNEFCNRTVAGTLVTKDDVHSRLVASLHSDYSHESIDYVNDPTQRFYNFVSSRGETSVDILLAAHKSYLDAGIKDRIEWVLTAVVSKCDTARINSYNLIDIIEMFPKSIALIKCAVEKRKDLIDTPASFGKLGQRSPLSVAVEAGNPAVVKYLLQQGANGYKEIFQGYFGFFRRQVTTEIAKIDGNPEMLRLFSENGFNIIVEPTATQD